MTARTRTKQPIAIWGARGHALVLLDFLDDAGFVPVVFFDNDVRTRSPLDGVPIIHGARGFSTWAKSHRTKGVAYAVAIGGDRGDDRIAIAKRLVSAGLTPATLVHPSAIVSRTATLESGCQVLAGAVVGAKSMIGADAIINTSASVDHECIIGRGSHVGPGAVLCGCVELGERVFVGSGAVVLPRIVIGDDAVVGAGAVVTKDVKTGTVAVGVPARPSRKTNLAKRVRR
ncbi:MAG TPA: acetyltransferase [Candidatus Eremiobacteraceae bacterium]|nr:acetyltransferase [Candidatus Eremiobacteraceae bacterium]